MARNILVLILFVIAVTSTPAQAAPVSPETGCPMEQWFDLSARIVGANKIAVTVTDATQTETPPADLAVWAVDQGGTLVYERIVTVPMLHLGESWTFTATVDIYTPLGMIAGYWAWQDRAAEILRVPGSCAAHRMMLYRALFPCAAVGSGAHCDGSMRGIAPTGVK